MGRIVATYVAPVSDEASAAWTLDATDFSYLGEYTGNDLNLTITAALSDFAGSARLTDAQLSSGPVNYSLPIVTGPTSYGYNLSSSNGVWLSNYKSLSFAYRWYRHGSFIAGAKSSTYATVLEDQGATITCGVRATDANGTSSEVLSAGFAMRATPWVQSNIRFDGSAKLNLAQNLYTNPSLTLEDGTTFGAYNLIKFYSGVMDASGSQNTQYILTQSTDSYIGLRKDILAATSGFEGEEDGIDTGSVYQQKAGITAGDRVSVLLYVRQGNPGRIEGTMCTRFEGGPWQYSSFTRAGPLVATQLGNVAIGDRANGGRQFTGTLSRAATWANVSVDALDLMPLEADRVGDPGIVDLFMEDDTTLRPPDVAVGSLGTPLVDFNGPLSDWQAGIHEGRLDTFNLTGLLT